MWIRARGWSVPSNPIPNRGAAFTPEQWQALTSTGVAVHLVVVPAGHRGPSRRRRVNDSWQCVGRQGIEEVTASHASMSEAAGAFTRYVGSTVLDASN